VAYMKQHKSIRMTVATHYVNYAFNWLAGRRFDAYRAYRYEDLAREPRATLADMIEFLGTPDQPGALFVSDTTVNLGPDHGASGNPDRFEQGIIAIRSDMEWRTKMDTRQKRLVTLLTLPWLVKFRYVFAGSSSGPRKVPDLPPVPE
jgi:hypothetical protein